MKIRIGTRKSKLAMWQAGYVAQRLIKHDMEVEICPITAKGDRILNVSLSKIGSKGVFTEELEALLQSGQVDIAVHSAKDVPSSLNEGFELIAFGERERPNDVLIGRSGIDRHSREVVVGSSSTRRVAMLKRYFPKATVVDMRGNLPTRVNKMEAGDCHMLVLAYAGVHRLGYGHMIRRVLDTDVFTPAVGQGSLAVESHEKLDKHKRDAIRTIINHPNTEKTIRAERSFLKKLGGGCSIPAFGLANLKDNAIVLHAGMISLDGQKLIQQKTSGKDPETLGLKTAETILKLGGDIIIKEIKTKP